MSRPSNSTLGVIGAAIVALVCCGAPLLIVAVGAASVTAWMSQSVYVLVPTAIIIVGIGIVWFVHHRRKAQDGGQPEAFKKVSKHE